MSSPATPIRPDTAADIPLGLLRRMARPGTSAEVHAKLGQVTVHAAGESSDTSELQSIPAEHWSWAVGQRAIARDPGTEIWRLTAHGRAILRRHLSTPTQAKPLHSRASQAARPQINVAESPLAWLHQRKDRNGEPLISDAQFKAGERLREDFERAHLNPRVTVSWDGVPSAPGRRGAPGMGMEIQDSIIAAGERVGSALRAVGPELSGVLVDVCCHLKGLEGVERTSGWPQRSARIVLLLALTRLARHYGFERSASPAEGRIRHWGSGDYRPAIADPASGPDRIDS